MSPFQEAMHEFVQASTEHSAGKDAWREGSPYTKAYAEEQAEQRLSAAGDRLEAILRQMMEQAGARASGEHAGSLGMCYGR